MIAWSSLDQKVNGIKQVQLFCYKLKTDRHWFAEQALMAPVCRVSGLQFKLSYFSLNELLWLVNDEIHHFVFRQVSLAAHETLSEKLQVPFMSNVKF